MSNTAEYNINARTNADYVLPITYEDSDENPIDITNYNIGADIVEETGTTVLAAFTIAKTDAVNGEFTMTLYIADIALLSDADNFYDLSMENTDVSPNITSVPMAGSIKVTTGIT